MTSTSPVSKRSGGAPVSPAQQPPCVTMCSEIKCCAAGSTTRRNASACGAHDTQGVDASTRNSIAPVNRTERSISDSTSIPDAGASDPEDWSWPLVIAAAILIRTHRSKESRKCTKEPGTRQSPNCTE